MNTAPMYLLAGQGLLQHGPYEAQNAFFCLRMRSFRLCLLVRNHLR